MAYSAGTLTLLGSANGFNLYHHDAGDDGIATVLTAGYFNNTDDDLTIAADDEFISVCSDGTIHHKVLSVSSGSVTSAVMDEIAPHETGTTAANLKATGMTVLAHTAAATFTLAAPFKGAVKRIFANGGTTLAMVVSSGSTAVTFDGSSQKITFDTDAETAVLVGTSATRWLIQVNTGTAA